MSEPLYKETRHVPQKVNDCYICGKPLAGAKSPDHVIPNSLFATGSIKRPKLPTHLKCNNDKSKDDEWFLRQLQKMCSLNPQALAGLNKLLDKALVEKPNARIIGKSKEIRNYKFARTVLQKDTWGAYTMLNGRTLSTLTVNHDDVQRLMEYMKRVCRGLFLLNVPDAAPALPQMAAVQYASAIKEGKYDAFMEPVKMFEQLSRDSSFVQEWPGQVLYIGSRITTDANKGFVFVEFYREAGFLAVFE